jgi:uncharacterized membrane protein SpoIIM required for sporulation
VTLPRLQRFLTEREPAWAELEALLARAGTRPERLAPEDLLRTGRLYRAAAADLALARRAFASDPVTRRLEALVLRGRQTVYADETPRRSVWRFLATDYWGRVYEHRWLLALAAALLLVPQVLAAVWALDDPAAAVGVVPSEFAGAAEPGTGPGALTPDAQAGLSSAIFTNNIQVSFVAVAGGLAFGLGTVAILLFNAVFLGAIEGLAIGGGQAARLFELIIPHGVLEESCIVVAGAAGLRIGRSLLEPGVLTRAQSLRTQARPAMETVLGTMPWLVLAGLVEGFVTGSLPGLGSAIAVGVGLAAVFWALVLWRGPAAAAQIRARDLARR